MKLIKLTADHYVIVDDSPLQKGDWFLTKENIVHNNYGYNYGDKKITHSTQPLEYTTEDHLQWDKIKRLSLSEVKELLGEVDVEVLSRKHHYNGTIEGGYLTGGFINGYNQALEDNKDKKYTDEDMIRAYTEGENVRYSIVGEAVLKSQFIQSLQPKTQWDVEFINGKLKLK